MIADLTGVDHKIGRAKHHIADLKTALDRVLGPDRQRVVLEREGQSTEHVCRVFGVPAIDPHRQVLIGDALFNLRSALDHLAWQLVILAGHNPTEQTQFPIRGTPFAKTGQLIGAWVEPPVHNPQIEAAIEESQPYRGADGNPFPVDRHPLWHLHRLNIIDKHRLLLVIASLLSPENMWWGWNSEWGPSPTLRLSFAPLKEGDPVAWFDFHGNEPPVDFDPHVVLQISLYETTEVPFLIGTPIDRALNILVRWVEQTIVDWRFRPLFP